MKSIAAVAVSALLAAPLSAQTWQAPCPPQRDPALWALLDEATESALREFPRWSGPTLGDDRYNDRLEDLSEAAVARRTQQAADRLAALRALDRAAFSEADHLDADLLAHDLALAVDAAAYHPEQTPVTSVNGPQYWLPQMADFAPFANRDHYDDYLRRLEAVPTLLAQHIANMRRGMDAGRVPPAVVVAPAVRQARAQVVDEPAASPFYKPFINHPANDPRARRAQQLIAQGVIPAYAAFTEFLETEYLPACRETIGVSDGPDGVAAYAYALREHTTLDLTADEVHAIGLAEVARLRAEMIEVIRRTDSPVNDRLWPVADTDALFAAFVKDLRTNPRFYYDDADTLLRAYRDICKTIDPELPRLFGRLPRLPYGVREIPPFTAPSSPSAYYYNGSLEGGVPGYFMVNTYRLDQRPIYEMTALAIHEAVPGHHLQIALAQEMENVHAYRKLTGYTAFVEGWALYSEGLGLEMLATTSPPLPSSPRPRGEDRGEGSASETQSQASATSTSPPRPLRTSASPRGLYTDPYQDFGRLNFDMWRAMRLVVDTGVHAKGWTRQQAVDYMKANSAISELNINSEVDRYIGWPGQACGYKLGQLRILALRREAEAALGADFDVRAFHDHLLGAGALPLPVLEARMKRWLEAQ